MGLYIPGGAGVLPSTVLTRTEKVTFIANPQTPWQKIIEKNSRNQKTHEELEQKSRKSSYLNESSKWLVLNPRTNCSFATQPH